MSEHADAPPGDANDDVRSTRVRMEQAAADLSNLALELEDKTDLPAPPTPD